jgi:hypothetical protein
LRKKVIAAYEAAYANPLYLPMNNLEDDYPEIHQVSAYTRDGIERNDCGGFVELWIEYPRYLDVANDVPKELLKLFYLDEELERWVLIENSKMDIQTDRIYGYVQKLGRVFTIMGYSGS